MWQVQLVKLGSLESEVSPDSVVQWGQLARVDSRATEV